MEAKRTFRILVVDDQEIIREMVARFCLVINPSATVETAADGMEAWDRICQNSNGNQFHVVITDINMPRENGIQLGSRVRAKYPEIRIIFMSGEPRGKYLADSDELFLAKPISLVLLKEVLFD